MSYRDDAAEALQEQYAFLARVKRLNMKKLLMEHAKWLDETEFRIDLPDKPDRKLLEDRLFWFHRAHVFPEFEEGDDLDDLKSRAGEILSDEYADEHQPTLDTARRDLRKHPEKFALKHLEKMDIKTVERYLHTLGLVADDNDEHKRMILYQVFHRPAPELGLDVKMRYGYNAMKAYRKSFVQAIIMANPEMTYVGYRRLFFDAFPCGVKRYSRYKEELRLRFPGKLPNMRSNACRVDKYATTQVRLANDSCGLQRKEPASFKWVPIDMPLKGFESG